VRDPGLASLRRAARVTIVAPVVFACYLEVADLPTAAMFGAFGAFALLAFADFGGDPWPRTRAYLALTAVGALLALLGTSLNPYPIAAALVAVLVAAGARFAGCFGGYLQASVSPLVLAFVLGATVPESGGGLGDRALGWATAGVLAALAGLVLWPRRERRLLRAQVARASDALGAALRDVAETGTVDDATATRVREEVGAMERGMAQPRRPAGPGAHDVVFAYAVDQVRRLATLVLETRDEPVPHDGTPGALVGAATRAVQAAADALRTDVLPDALAPAVVDCVELRAAAVADAAARLEAGLDPGAVVDEVDAAFAVRLLAFLAASLGANVGTLLGRSVLPPGTSGAHEVTPLEVPAPGLGGAARRLRTLIATHLVPTSTWAQESVRAGCAVGAAVLIALVWDLQHGFWVVLGTLSVLRSNAFSTGRSALDSAFGTAVGFAISAGLLALVGFDRAGLWVLVIVGFFLAAYTPQVVGFVVGQASFTVLVVALFNLIEPQGWRTGLVRVEDIAIGVTVSAVVSLLFWPRRAVHQLRITTVALLDSVAGGIGRAFRGDPESAPVRRAERRAHAAYEGYLSERLGAPPRDRPWAAVLATASQGRGAIVALEHHPDLTALVRAAPVGDALGGAADAVADGFTDLARRIRHAAQAGPAAPGATAGGGDGALDARELATRTRAPVAQCIATHAHDDRRAAALDTAFARDWLVALGELVGAARTAAGHTA
jgi:uncharacterized membrane protein YccC